MFMVRESLMPCLSLCDQLNITIDKVIYVGDDINCFELLNEVGLAQGPKNSNKKLFGIPGILKLKSSGGEGVIREVYETLV